MFTIIIPTHDRPLLLLRTLQSLAAQTFTNFTVIIVSDSTNYVPPYAALHALPGRYIYMIRNGVLGPAESRNLALEMISTDYVLFLDDDDTLDENHLEGLSMVIETSHPDILSCNFRVIQEERSEFPPKLIGEFLVSTADAGRESVFIRNRIPNSCLAFAREVVKSVRFDPMMILYEDWDFLLACLHGHDIYHVPINSVRIHKSIGDGAANMRRGISADDQILQYTLALYKKYKPQSSAASEGRRQLFDSLNITLADEYL